MKKRKTRVSKSTLDFTSRFMLWFGAGNIAVTFIYIFCITFIEVPKDNQKFADTILGFLMGTLVATIIQFYFGSSHNSRDKDKSLETITELQSAIMGKLGSAFDEVRAKHVNDDSEDEEDVDEEPEDTDDGADLTPPMKG